jgi:hypothetical protein
MAIQIFPEFPPVCGDCGHPLKIDFQTLIHKVMIFHTCKNPLCLLRDVTLEDSALLNMTAERAEEYRIVNRARDEVSPL